MKTMRSYGAIAFNGAKSPVFRSRQMRWSESRVLRPARPVRRDQLNSWEKGLVPGEVLRIADIQHAWALPAPAEVAARVQQFCKATLVEDEVILRVLLAWLEPAGARLPVQLFEQIHIEKASRGQLFGERFVRRRSKRRQERIQLSIVVVERSFKASRNSALARNSRRISVADMPDCMAVVYVSRPAWSATRLKTEA